jgi:hypothetical protein
MTTVIATPALLQEAQKAYHALMTGVSARVVVDSDGSRVEFTAANKSALYNYISQLEAQLGVGCGGQPVPMAKYHPATFVF